jgi:phospholipid-transporting ATPase
MTYLLLIILILEMVFCTVVAVCSKVYYNNTIYMATYLQNDLNGDVMALIAFFSYLLLFNTLIPISLLISLEIVKMFQGVFIMWDVEMYSKVRNKFVKPCSISLNEELGQVNFIFSDKTGTLTGNKMSFKYCVIGIKYCNL